MRPLPLARLIRATLLSAVLIALITGRAALAQQGWPAPSGQPVDDHAGVITTEVASALNATLTALRAETGIEVAVVTLPTRDGLPPAPTLADFARALFDARRIGRADRNDGILILLVMDEQAVRIALGAGYSSGYDVIAQDVVTRWFLPDLRRGDVAAALTAGVDQTITRIAQRHAAGLSPEAPHPPPATGRGIWPALALAGIAALAFLRRRRRRAESQDDGAAAPAGDRHRDRRDDGPRDAHPQDERLRDADDDRGGGGGRSSGGGAGGRW